MTLLYERGFLKFVECNPRKGILDFRGVTMKGNSGILSAWSKVQRILDFRGVTQKGIYKFPGVTLLHQREFISFNNETKILNSPRSIKNQCGSVLTSNSL